MQRLVDRRVQRAVGQLVAGENVGVAHQPDAHRLMHHGIQQDDVVGLEGDNGLEPGLPEQLFGDDADAVPRPLQDEGCVAQIFQPDLLLPRQRVGGRQRDQKLLVGDGNVRDLGAGGAGTQGKVHRSAGNGPGLLGSIQLGQAQGDIRVAAGELVVDLAEDDGPPVGGGGQTDGFAAESGHFLHGQEHPVLFVQDLLGAVHHMAPHGGGVQAAVVAQKQCEPEGMFAFGQKLAQRGRGDVQRLGGMAQVAVGCNGGKVIILFCVHMGRFL